MKKSKSTTPIFSDAKAKAMSEWNPLASVCQEAVNKFSAWEDEAAKLYEELHDATVPEAEKYIKEHPPSAGAIAILILVTADKLHSDKAKHAANALHEKPGGSREKKCTIRDIWATGKYQTRQLCAEEECTALGSSYESARRALQNTPDPYPWPGKKQSKKR